uniref:Uncharacterized protein n=1 Tax=Gossypium raimondii TaxID=29730 RepID=A0A0D2P0W4_GOSRA|nr:hypothetical protein B456_003G132800 [Gossypium raimondii]
MDLATSCPCKELCTGTEGTRGRPISFRPSVALSFPFSSKLPLVSFHHQSSILRLFNQLLLLFSGITILAWSSRIISSSQILHKRVDVHDVPKFVTKLFR